MTARPFYNCLQLPPCVTRYSEVRCIPQLLHRVLQASSVVSFVPAVLSSCAAIQAIHVD